MTILERLASSIIVPAENKLVALSENGCVMDPDKVMETNSRWLYWGTWKRPVHFEAGYTQ